MYVHVNKNGMNDDDKIKQFWAEAKDNRQGMNYLVKVL